MLSWSSQPSVLAAISASPLSPPCFGSEGHGTGWSPIPNMFLWWDNPQAPGCKIQGVCEVWAIAGLGGRAGDAESSAGRAPSLSPPLHVLHPCLPLSREEIQACSTQRGSVGVPCPCASSSQTLQHLKDIPAVSPTPFPMPEGYLLATIQNAN